jgi:hypothetical protein
MLPLKELLPPMEAFLSVVTTSEGFRAWSTFVWRFLNRLQEDYRPYDFSSFSVAEGDARCVSKNFSAFFDPYTVLKFPLELTSSNLF